MFPRVRVYERRFRNCSVCTVANSTDVRQRAYDCSIFFVLVAPGLPKRLVPLQCPQACDPGCFSFRHLMSLHARSRTLKAQNSRKQPEHCCHKLLCQLVQGGPRRLAGVSASTSAWATLIPPVVWEEGAEALQSREMGTTRDLWGVGILGPEAGAAEAAPPTGSSLPQGLPTRRAPRRGGARRGLTRGQGRSTSGPWRGDARSCPRSPRPLRGPQRAPARPAVSGAQVWPGRQVESALAGPAPPQRSREPSGPSYLRVQLGHRHGQEGPGPGRGCSTCEAWGLGLRRRGRAQERRARKSPPGHLAQSFPMASCSRSRVGGEGRRQRRDWSLQARPG